MHERERVIEFIYYEYLNRAIALYSRYTPAGFARSDFLKSRETTVSHPFGLVFCTDRDFSSLAL